MYLICTNFDAMYLENMHYNWSKFILIKKSSASTAPFRLQLENKYFYFLLFLEWNNEEDELKEKNLGF